jgi:zinc transporter
VIVFPLTLLAAIFGMDTPGMPLANHPYGFWIILTSMLFSALGLLWFFEKKKWL